MKQQQTNSNKVSRETLLTKNRKQKNEASEDSEDSEMNKEFKIKNFNRQRNKKINWDD